MSLCINSEWKCLIFIDQFRCSHYLSLVTGLWLPASDFRLLFPLPGLAYPPPKGWPDLSVRGADRYQPWATSYELLPIANLADSISFSKKFHSGLKFHNTFPIMGLKRA